MYNVPDDDQEDQGIVTMLRPGDLFRRCQQERREMTTRDQEQPAVGAQRIFLHTLCYPSFIIQQ